MYDNPLARSLNATPMHKLVQTILMGQVLIAYIMGAFGLIAYGPPAIIASSIVLVAVSIAANALLSRLYGVRSDGQSALITGLILALVLTPGLDPLRLGTIALVAVIAQASKYIIAVRGRHIFNPAAIGLVVAGLVGLTYASWWIATPAMLFFALSGAFVMLYKLRLLRVGGVFIAVSGLLITVMAVGQGTNPVSAFATAYTSWPILFLAGFMLTEPTTLPPRLWQKLLVAGIVGVIFGLPFHLGFFQSTPAFALIVGNLIAFAFGQRRRISLTLRGIRPLTPTASEFVFTPEHPLHFIPGQYLDLFLPHPKADFKSTRRSFSLTSVPLDSDVSIGVRTSGSSFKKALFTLAPGTRIAASNVGGDFVLPKDPSQKLLFIAGGIGITPFISQLRAESATRDIVLLYFVTSPQEAAYQKNFEPAAVHIFTKGERLTLDVLARFVPDAAARVAYISGPPTMVDASKKAVRRSGVRRIKTDYFSGY